LPFTNLTSSQDFAHYKSGVYKHVTGHALGGHAVKLIGWGTTDDGQDYWVCWYVPYLHFSPLGDTIWNSDLYTDWILFIVSASRKSVEQRMGRCMFLDLFLQLECLLLKLCLRWTNLILTAGWLLQDPKGDKRMRDWRGGNCWFAFYQKPRKRGDWYGCWRCCFILNVNAFTLPQLCYYVWVLKSKNQH